MPGTRKKPPTAHLARVQRYVVEGPRPAAPGVANPGFFSSQINEAINRRPAVAPRPAAPERARGESGTPGYGTSRTYADRFRQRADEIIGRGYTPFGAGTRQRANELLAQSKIGQRPVGQAWNLGQFSDDTLRLILSDDGFARQVLKEFDPSFSRVEPTPQQLASFRQEVANSEGARVYPHMAQTPHRLYPRIGEEHGISPEQAARTREGLQSVLAGNRNLAQQAENLLSRANRIAPLSPLHTRARQLIERNNPTEGIELGRNEIAAARNINIPNAMNTYMQRASDAPESYMAQYMQRYQPLIQNFREEARRDFLEHDLPTINKQFAGRGAFYSSARQKALHKAIENREARIIREARNLTVHGQEQAMKDFNAARHHHLQQAQVAGHAHQAQAEANIRAAEALRVNALSGQAATNQQAMALSNFGNIEQRQQQHERDVAMQEHEREQERPWEEGFREAALLGHMPPGTFQTQFSPQLSNPPPPNPYSAFGGTLAQMTGLAMQPHQQQQQHFAKGGAVRRGYAAGDSVKRAAAELAEMRKHTEGLPEETEMRQRAQGFNNYRDNPQADYLFALGNHMLGNLQEDPMKTFAQGSDLGMRAFKAAGAHNLSLKEKEDNTLDKINQTKMYQQQFLSKHHATMLQQEEMGRHHKAQEAESKRAHDIMQEHYKTKDALSIAKPMKMTASDRKLESDARKDLLRSLRMKKELGHLGELVNQTSTGPIIGGIKGILPKTKNDNKIDVITNKLILDMHQGMKNIPRSEEFLKRIETTKPNRSNYPEANEQAISLMSQGADDVLEHSISTLLSSGWTPEKIEKQFKIKIPTYLLAEEEQLVEENPSEEEQPAQTTQGPDETTMVNMIAPDGGQLNVPLDKVEEMEKLGAQIVN